MGETLKQFLIDNQELIKRRDYNTLFDKWNEQNMYYNRIPDLTLILEKAKVDFLPYMDHIVPYMYYNSDLTEFTVPMNIKEIASSAFEDSSRLKNVIINPNINVLQTCTFKNCRSLESILIPSSVKKLHASVFYGCPEDLKIITTRGSAADKYAQDSLIDVKYIN